jgi:hypothetical protein
LMPPKDRCKSDTLSMADRVLPIAALKLSLLRSVLKGALPSELTA